MGTVNYKELFESFFNSVISYSDDEMVEAEKVLPLSIENTLVCVREEDMESARLYMRELVTNRDFINQSLKSSLLECELN